MQSNKFNELEKDVQNTIIDYINDNNNDLIDDYEWTLETKISLYTYKRQIEKLKLESVNPLIFDIDNLTQCFILECIAIKFYYYQIQDISLLEIGNRMLNNQASKSVIRLPIVFNNSLNK